MVVKVTSYKPPWVKVVVILPHPVALVPFPKLQIQLFSVPGVVFVNVTVRFAPLLMLYVNVYGAVPFAPVKVIVEDNISITIFNH